VQLLILFDYYIKQNVLCNVTPTKYGRIDVTFVSAGSDEVESRPSSSGAVQRDKEEWSAAMPACRSLALCRTGPSHSSTEVPVFLSCSDVVSIHPAAFVMLTFL